MRRANGAGSISKLSGSRRRPWMARVTVGWDDMGKQLFKTIGYYRTKAEAEEAIALDRVMPVSEHRNITLAQLYAQWQKTRAYTDLSRQTRANYDAAHKGYMSEYHNVKFADLRLPHFQNMVDKAFALGRSRSTLSKIKVLSGILCSYASSQDIVIKDYSQDVRMPKQTKKRVQTFSDTEIKKLFKNDSAPIVDTILILIYTGMRIQELLTLTKFHVDVDNMLITGGSKTEAGTDRVIPIHPRIQKYVRARYSGSRNYLIEYPAERGNKRKGTFINEPRPYRYEHYCDLYYQTLDALGIRRLTPHKACHTFFTMLSDKCKDRAAMALVGGHSDPNFTDKTYVQPDVDRLRRAIESI